MTSHISNPEVDLKSDICNLQSLDIPDLLANLVERSLVVCDPVTGRHSMTESMRAYTMENLTDDDRVARKRHLDYFTFVAEHCFSLTMSGEETGAYELFIRDEDNLRSAFEWSLENDPNACLHLTACLLMPWQMRFPNEILTNAERVLTTAPNGAVADLIWLRVNLAYVRMRRSESATVSGLLNLALKDLETVDMPPAKTIAMLTMAWWDRENGREEFAMDLILGAMEIARENNLPRHEALAYTSLGEFARERRDFDEATRCYQEALAKCGSKLRSAMNLYNLGQVSIEKNDVDAAEQFYRRALECVADSGPIPMTNALIGSLGSVFMMRGEYHRGGLVMGWAQGWRDHRGSTMDYNDRNLFDRLRASGEERGGEEFTNALKDGSCLTFEQVSVLVEEAVAKGNARKK